MRPFLTSIFFLICSINVQAKELALTFDDAPRDASGYFDGTTRAIRLIQELKEHQVDQAAFFVTTENLDEEGKARINTYADAGHILANHTHSHPDFNQLTLDEYIQDFVMADKELSAFKNTRKLFRFPYLREGDTQEKRDGMRDKLKALGFKNAYITLNNYDWYIENLFQQAVANGIKVDLEKLKKLYVDVIIEGAEYYDQLSVTHLGRSPKHVLLLHEMDVTALFIGDLVDELRSRGWKIISLEEAYTDAIASYETDRVMRFNPGRIGEIARDKGQRKGLWHNSLDETYLKKRFESEVLNLSQETLSQ